MTLKDWLKINPNHKVTLTASNSGGVRAVLSGGDGLDQRIVGEGDDVAEAHRQALETRDKIRQVLT